MLTIFVIYIATVSPFLTFGSHAGMGLELRVVSNRLESSENLGHIKDGPTNGQ
jgi:hypothetical protein